MDVLQRGAVFAYNINSDGDSNLCTRPRQIQSRRTGPCNVRINFRMMVNCWRLSNAGNPCRKAVETWRGRTAFLVVVGLALAACAQVKSFRSEAELPKSDEGLRVLLMTPDVELSELTTGGLLEPNAEWTDAARVHLEAAVEAFLGEKDAQLVAYQRPDEADAAIQPETQLIKLHAAVGLTILRHKYIPQLSLPTKKDKFDWSLGPGVMHLRDAYDAKYGLFIYVRDSYATSGRVAFMIVAALLGVGVQGGVQAGFASLVDLETGELVWFNRLVSTKGDLRKPGPAQNTVKLLLEDFPI